ncbi:hypothetical protein [Brachyspira alvinipulli]
MLRILTILILILIYFL